MRQQREVRASGGLGYASLALPTETKKGETKRVSGEKGVAAADQ